jgi:multimeric flavodoxin WrbA
MGLAACAAMKPTVRKGQAPEQLGRDEFHERFAASFVDPAFDPERPALQRIEEIAWRNYKDSRKAPLTRKAGPGYADPDYDLSDEWRETRDRLLAAEKTQKDPAVRSRVLVIVGSARNDGSCPGEMSKTYRLARIAAEVLEQGAIQADLLDLSLLTSEYGRRIYPCKSCVSTAQPLCHWPCSCYPNHALGQTGDWMAEIYERWVLAHGVLLLTPVNWYHSSSALKLMVDRMVCADGGNPDPTSTHGKDAEKAKAIELDGWPFPKHLEGRLYGLVVHGDVTGAELTRSSLSQWLEWMGLIRAGDMACLDRYVNYYGPYATSHEALDADEAMQEETRNVARALATAVADLRAGRLSIPDAGLERPRSK